MIKRTNLSLPPLPEKSLPQKFIEINNGFYDLGDLNSIQPGIFNQDDQIKLCFKHPIFANGITAIYELYVNGDNKDKVLKYIRENLI